MSNDKETTVTWHAVYWRVSRDLHKNPIMSMFTPRAVDAIAALVADSVMDETTRQ